MQNLLYSMINVSLIISLICSLLLLRKYRRLLKESMDALENNVKLNAETQKYCLSDIMNKAVEREDYVTAEKCRKLIDNIK